jgi:cysteine sulfinate desulfinase/cysteine desulfurase-like protein
VLEAIGLSIDLAKAAVLISPGQDTTSTEVDRFVELFTKVVTRLREMSPSWEEHRRGRK